jgi:hypothetical protein
MLVALATFVAVSSGPLKMAAIAQSGSNNDTALEHIKRNERALEDINKAATEICYDVGQQGSQTEKSLSGQADVNLSELFKKVIGLGVTASADLKTSKYQNVVRKQLAETLTHSMDCKRDVFDTLAPLLVTDQRLTVGERSLCPLGYITFENSSASYNLGAGITAPATVRLCIINSALYTMAREDWSYISGARFLSIPSCAKRRVCISGRSIAIGISASTPRCANAKIANASNCS